MIKNSFVTYSSLIRCVFINMKTRELPGHVPCPETFPDILAEFPLRQMQKIHT